MLLPPQIVSKGFMETPENSPPLLEGRRMQIMVIPRGVRKVVVHFLVYDPLKKSAKPHTRSPNPNPQNVKDAANGKGKLRKKESINKLGRGSSKGRDQTTNQRSTSRLSNSHPDPNLISNFDGMEIEVIGKPPAIWTQEEREEDEEGEFVVMKRVVKLPRKVWCGRNCKDKFEQLFIRRT
ncbi:hypothetical protein NHQ30_000349 [Ciborinia camelliae]|nr:hypothetical protein NHQ30_000349 [Ciborinia camelliae]